MTQQPAPTLGWKNPKNFKDDKEAQQLASDYLVKILSANVYDAAVETPLTYATSISNQLNNKIYYKREDTQPVFSFKIRGAVNKIMSLDESMLRNGVVTCSAGNHAQGVALSSNQLNIKATIVMPEATPKIKVNAVRAFGGDNVNLVLHGKTYDEAATEANRISLETGAAMIHPFDDAEVIAGQGTIGMEILKVSDIILFGRCLRFLTIFS